MTGTGLPRHSLPHPKFLIRLDRREHGASCFASKARRRMDEKISIRKESSYPIRMLVTGEDGCHASGPITTTADSKPAAAPRKQTALDVANMIAPPRRPASKDGPRPGLPATGSGKPLDLSHRGPPASSAAAAAAYKAFYPYPTLPLPASSLSPYPYLNEPTGSAIAPGGYGAGYASAAYPLYGSYPIAAADSTAPSLSTLRLSALLASRKRRAAATSAEKCGEAVVGVSAAAAAAAAATAAAEPSRKKVRPVPEEKKDSSYWDRRRKNNDAAKRSRDARREKEEEIALRAVFLEQENMKLRAEVSILKSEMGRLHYMVYNC